MRDFELVYRDNLRLIVFDVNDDRFNAEKMLRYFEASENYSDWWNHFPGVFIVRSKLDPNEINNDIGDSFSPTPSLICTEFRRPIASARLDERAWRWILDLPDHVLDPLFESVKESEEKKDNAQT